MASRQAEADRSDWGCDIAPRDIANRDTVGRGLAGLDAGRSFGASRRAFLRNGALALVGTSVIPAFLTRSLYAEMRTASTRGRKLVVVFQRGACDGLNVVVPYTEKNYYAMRPTIAIQPNEVLDLDGQFGLHPAMASLLPLYRAGHLGVVHAAGSPDPTRSHFDAQDYMESGTPGIKATPDGWLNRALAEQPAATRGAGSPFSAVALGPQVPRTLQGRFPAVALANLQDFGLTAAHGADAQPVANAFQAMYDESSDTLLHGTGQETFEAMRMLRSANPARYTPNASAHYPATPFGNDMRQIAQLLKASLGVEAAFADIGGWDTHQNQGAANGQLANRLRDFSDAISAFWLDMGDDAEQITLVTMSEFGRTARQNGTGGTDHGHANVMFVAGGPTPGGKVNGRWPGLAPEQLNEGRDLVVTTDFRSVLAESVVATLGSGNLHRVFPGLNFEPTSA